MKIRELMEAVKLHELLNLPKPNQQQQQRRTPIVKPEAVKQQQTVRNLVNKIAVSDAKRAPSEEEKVLLPETVTVV